MPIDRDYKIGASERACHTCGRRFAVGESYYSAVVEAEPEAEEMFVRRDFCPDCWSPDPEAYFSYWKTRVPEPPPARTTGPRLVDLGRLMQLFEHLAEADREEARRFRYVLALVLMRKKRLRLESSRRVAGGRSEELTLRESGKKRQHVVTCPTLSEDGIRSVTDRLGDILDMPDRWDRIEVGEDEAARDETPEDETAVDEAAEAEPADDAGEATDV
jgi:hypothetical protein